MPSPPPRRAWGTRYDSLVDTPPLGSPHVSSPDVALHLRSATGTVHVELVQNNIDTCSPIQARMPHDASVFVASLPSHIPEAELQVLLSEHLSQHANIKHIKLIRDNRGAVCAFVQVESASQASNLIAACGLSPFMDRHIRCEKARAFRTLLVSWRPAAASTQASNDLQGRARGGAESSPLRLRRCRGTKYIQVSLGSEAISSDPAQLPNYTPPRPDDPLSGSGILFPGGLKEGDLKCLKTLLEAFGPLEFITPFEAATHIPIPPPHTSTYASELPSGEERAFMRGGSAFASIKDVGDENSEHARPQPPMWAVKWEHRNDAVSAITASIISSASSFA
ncbi:hypothetical protein JB92DRAFT_1707480 [Gautieria morchelliformis]|nr:hypothetical protein JB92DRAFT_1707480 [Gautieria morchelliformis]